MLRLTFRYLILTLGAVAGCVPFHRTTGRPPAAALITPDSAMFVFPPESLAVLTWNPRVPSTNPVGVDWTWAVQWQPAAPGTDSVYVIAVSRAHRAGEPIRHGSLQELLAETSAEEGSFCWGCREPATRFRPLAGVVAYARGNQAIVVVRGRCSWRLNIRHP